MHDGVSQSIAENAARIPGEHHGGLGNPHGFERRRSDHEGAETEKGRELWRIDALGVGLAALRSQFRTEGKESNHDEAEHEPPGGKTENPQQEIRAPGAPDAAEIRWRSGRCN